jgi:hypothetical protein
MEDNKMSRYNTSTTVNFWIPSQILIEEIESASSGKYFNLQGEYLDKFEPRKRIKLEDFTNRFVATTEDGDFIEFTSPCL